MTLTRELPPDLQLARLPILVAIATVAMTAVVVVTEWTDHAVAEATSWPMAMMAVALLVAFALTLVARARNEGRPRVQRIDVWPGRITVADSAGLFSGHPWSIDRPGRVVADSRGIDPRTGRRLGDAAVRTCGPFGRRLLTNEPYDECVWVAEVLNAALGHGPPEGD